MTESEHLLKHQAASGVMDWLRLVFHADIGEGHLEHLAQADAFDVDSAIDFDFSIHFPSFTCLALIEQVPVYLTFFPDVRLPYSQTDVEYILLRGPPAIA